MQSSDKTRSDCSYVVVYKVVIVKEARLEVKDQYSHHYMFLEEIPHFVMTNTLNPETRINPRTYMIDLTESDSNALSILVYIC